MIARKCSRPILSQEITSLDRKHLQISPYKYHAPLTMVKIRIQTSVTCCHVMKVNTATTMSECH